jgi:hypothetical protein
VAHVAEYVTLGRIERARELLAKYRAAGLTERVEWQRAISLMIEYVPELYKNLKEI